MVGPGQGVDAWTSVAGLGPFLRALKKDPYDVMTHTSIYALCTWSLSSFIMIGRVQHGSGTHKGPGAPQNHGATQWLSCCRTTGIRGRRVRCRLTHSKLRSQSFDVLLWTSASGKRSTSRGRWAGRVGSSLGSQEYRLSYCKFLGSKSFPEATMTSTFTFMLSLLKILCSRA